MNKPRIEQFNFWRVFFCIIIVFHHYDNYYSICPISNVLGNICYAGRLGVEFFFMLSGFLISYNYYDNIKQMSIVSFLKRRLSNLYPMLLFAMLLNIILKVVDYILHIPTNDPLTLYSIITSALLIHSGWFYYNEFSSMTNWFSNVLVLCYIIWFCFSKKSNRKKYVMLCILMVSIGYSCLYRYLDIPFLYSNSCRGYLSFFIGCLLYEIYNEINEHMGIIVSRVLAFINIFVLLLILYYPNLLGDYVMVFTIFSCPIIIFSSLYLKSLMKITQLKIFKRMAKYSMCIFLTHQFVLSMINRINTKLEICIDFSIYLLYNIWVICFGGA